MWSLATIKQLNKSGSKGIYNLAPTPKKVKRVTKTKPKPRPG